MQIQNNRIHASIKIVYVRNCKPRVFNLNLNLKVQKCLDNNRYSLGRHVLEYLILRPRRRQLLQYQVITMLYKSIHFLLALSKKEELDLLHNFDLNAKYGPCIGEI